jgi:hypothetical protein
LITRMFNWRRHGGARGNLMARSNRRTKALGLWKVNATLYVAALTIDALQFAQADADIRGIGL